MPGGALRGCLLTVPEPQRDPLAVPGLDLTPDGLGLVEAERGRLRRAGVGREQVTGDLAEPGDLALDNLLAEPPAGREGVGSRRVAARRRLVRRKAWFRGGG